MKAKLIAQNFINQVTSGVNHFGLEVVPHSPKIYKGQDKITLTYSIPLSIYGIPGRTLFSVIISDERFKDIEVFDTKIGDIIDVLKEGNASFAWISDQEKIGCTIRYFSNESRYEFVDGDSVICVHGHNIADEIQDVHLVLLKSYEKHLNMVIAE